MFCIINSENYRDGFQPLMLRNHKHRGINYKVNLMDLKMETIPVNIVESNNMRE